MNAKLKIIAKAVMIRMDNGELLEEILLSYPALDEREKAELRKYIQSQR